MQKDLWADFKGKANTPEILREKSNALAVGIVMASQDTDKSLLELLKDEPDRLIDEAGLRQVPFEFALLYLHYADRVAYQHLGGELRDVFMDRLLLMVRNLLAEEYMKEGHTAEFEEQFTNAYVEIQDEYSGYPIAGRPVADTLDWKFGKHIAELIGASMDIMVIYWALELVSRTVGDTLKLSQLFE